MVMSQGRCLYIYELFQFQSQCVSRVEHITKMALMLADLRLSQWSTEVTSALSLSSPHRWLNIEMQVSSHYWFYQLHHPHQVKASLFHFLRRSKTKSSESLTHAQIVDLDQSTQAAFECPCSSCSQLCWEIGVGCLVCLRTEKPHVLPTGIHQLNT